MPTPDILLQLLIIGLTNGAVIALNALGLTLIYGTTRAINLAHGDVFALCTVLVTTLVTALGLQAGVPLGEWLPGIGLTLVAAMVLGSGLSWGVGRVAFAPFRGRSRLAPLIATLGIAFVLYQVALIWRYLLPNWIPGEHRSVPGVPELPRDSIPEVIPVLTLFRWGSIMHLTLKDGLVLVLAIGLAVGVHLWLQHGRFGRALRACAQHEELAQMCGIDPRAVMQWAFALGGALAGAGAFVFAIYYTHPFNQHGVQSGLLAFAAAIIGGIGSPIGALLGGLLLGVVAAFSDYFWRAQWTPVLVQGLLVGLLLWRPTGFARAETNEDLTRTERDAVAAGAAPGPRWRWFWLGALLLGLLFPVLDGLLGWHSVVKATGLSVLVLLAVGLNLLLGLAGLLDLGYAVSFGVGGYAAALLLKAWPGVDFAVVLLVSAVAAGAFGALNGGLTARLRSDYLAIVTLVLGQMVRQVLINLDAWTGGYDGLAALPPPMFLGYALRQPIERYYLILGFVLLAVFFTQRLRTSRIGRAWRAASEDETAATSSGIALMRYKTLAFVLSMALAGVGGALYASSFTYIDPEVIDFRFSALVLAMVVLGGAGHLPGVVLGALALGIYDRFALPGLSDWLGARPGAALPVFDVRGLSYLNFGLALCGAVLLRLRGRK